MTTCPFEDIFVVWISVMPRTLAVRQPTTFEAKAQNRMRRASRAAWRGAALRAGALLLFCGGLACQSEERTVGVVLDTDLGEIEVRVYPDRAPISANNFLAWVAGGHYEGATIYRVTRPDNTTGPGAIEVVQGGLLGEELRSGAPTSPSTGPIPPIAHERADTTGAP